MSPKLSSKIKPLIYLSLLLLNYVYSGEVEFIEENSKYEKEEYLDYFEIPKDLMTYSTNAGELNNNIFSI